MKGPCGFTVKRGWLRPSPLLQVKIPQSCPPCPLGFQGQEHVAPCVLGSPPPERHVVCFPLLISTWTPSKQDSWHIQQQILGVAVIPPYSVFPGIYLNICQTPVPTAIPPWIHLILEAKYPPNPTKPVSSPTHSHSHGHILSLQYTHLLDKPFNTQLSAPLKNCSLSPPISTCRVNPSSVLPQLFGPAVSGCMPWPPPIQRVKSQESVSRSTVSYSSVSEPSSDPAP